MVSECDGRRSWLSYEDDVCLFCECHGQVSATCRVVKPACQAVSCKDPVIPVGECCPYCGIYEFFFHHKTAHDNGGPFSLLPGIKN